jgi:hypothetical protein
MRLIASITAMSLVASALILTGCARQEGSQAAPAAAPDTAATGTPAEQPGTESTADASPAEAQSWIDDVTMGTQVAADGSVPADSTGDDFAPGQPVHVAMKVADAPASAAVKVIWFGPNDTKVGEEIKQVQPGAQYLSFAAQNTNSWAKGDYRAEVWVGDEKVDEQRFNVTDASKAAEAGKRPDRG